MAAAREHSRRATLVAGVRDFVRAIQEDDEALSEAVVRLSRSRRIFAPLAFTVGAFALLWEGLKVLLSNWRLMLIQILPAVWIWLAMFDLKIHVLHGRSFHSISGPVLGPIGLVITAITAGCFFLNAVFGFAITAPRPPRIRPAVARARERARPILLTGSLVGVMLSISTLLAPRWGPPWFSVTLGAVVGVMMISYVAVPARLVGVKKQQSKRDKLTASMLSTALGATVCTPPYLLGRLGILMLGTRALLIPGIFCFAVGVTVQAGATGAVRAIKMSTRLAAGASPEEIAAAAPPPAT